MRDFLKEVQREREAERLLLAEFHNDASAMGLALLAARDRIEELESTPLPAAACNAEALPSAPGATPVVVLDEWRVAYANGSTTFTYFSAREAAKRAAKDNETFEGCGARVMRVCLQEVPGE